MWMRYDKAQRPKEAEKPCASAVHMESIKAKAYSH